MIKTQNTGIKILLKAFRACGCDPERGEVGIMTAEDYNKQFEVK